MTRVLVFWALGFAGLTLTGALRQWLGMQLWSVDLPLLIVLYVALLWRSAGQRRSILTYGRPLRLFDVQSVSIVLGLGYLSDVLGGTPKGWHALVLSAIYVMGRLFAQHVKLDRLIAQVVATLLISLFAGWLTLALRSALGVELKGSMMQVVFGQAVLTAAVAPPVLALLSWVDRRLLGESSHRIQMP